MNLISLQSGSNGNCLYVEAGGVNLFFDAGISGRQASERLAALGRDIRDADALIVSHEHADHVRCAGVFQRKFGMPLFITGKTLQAARRSNDPGRLHDVCHFRAGGSMSFGSVKVETIATPHDGVDGVSFIVDDGVSRLGIFTDLGHVYGDLEDALESVDAALIESNYDPGMLSNGPYPRHVKNRISGPHGHISNLESAELVARCGNRLRWVCLGHLSGENNTPGLALSTHRGINETMIYHLADRHGPGDVLTI